MRDDTYHNMITQEEILLTLSGMRDELERKFHVERIGIFGSYARGDQHPESDIDFLVDFSEGADLFDLIKLRDYLSETFHHRVDVVPVRALREEFRQRVLAEVNYA